ncbi:sialoadhesin-like isoform X2 [Labeo rohita]|uniref:Sialoadhesin-like isoform X2 n=1 Tax=Labeo rohita TaxID=84645 RepID=A0A498LKL8_LABRO|nr:sialoadhesin-like isoform X2 [Labeo rohita]
MLLPGSASPPDEPEVKLTRDQQSKRTALILQPISRRYCQRSDTLIGNDRGDAPTLGFFSSPTATIDVWEASPPQPSIKIYGGLWIGDTITIVCSTFHTCPYSKPNITLNNIEGSDETDNEHVEDGLWKFTLTRTSVTNAENMTIEFPDHEEADVPIPPKTDWLYILMPSLVCILAYILACVIIYKRRRRQTPGDMQRCEERVEASLVRVKVTLNTGDPELLVGPKGARLLWILSKSSAPETGDLTLFTRGPSVSRRSVMSSVFFRETGC